MRNQQLSRLVCWTGVFFLPFVARLVVAVLFLPSCALTVIHSRLLTTIDELVIALAVVIVGSYVVAVIGVLIWIGIHLPPIQSLEIPKRPPSVLILGDNGATLTTRGESPAGAGIAALSDTLATGAPRGRRIRPV